MKYLFIAVIAAFLLVSGFWFIAIPQDLIVSKIENSIQADNYHVDVIGFEKGLFYNFRSDSIILKKTGRELITINTLSGKVNPLSLLMLRLPLIFNGKMGEGKIHGNIELLKAENIIHVRDAGIDNIPFFEHLGLNGSGTLSGDLSMKKESGDIKFTANNLKCKSWTLGDITVPMEMFHTAKGAMSVNGNTVTILSFVLEGDGIYARIKGNIISGQTDLSMEVMPEKALTEKSFIFSLIENYKVSPGYYVIPIKINLGIY